ncbi:MAG: efflux RND transporter periplasmic adaptor subunit [Pirellulales bacterium]
MQSTLAPKVVILRQQLPTILAVLAAGLVIAAAIAWPQLRQTWGTAPTDGDAEHGEHGSPEHAGHDHGHAGHSAENSLQLSQQARDSIGLREGEVALSTFQRTITVPGTVAERPGWSKFDIIAPMTGFVVKILHTEGEAVAPGQPLFELRLTHEDLVQSQADLLKTAEELDVVKKEIARLEAITQGVIAPKTILERKYELQKLGAVSHAQRQSLLLHGLTESQVDDIVKNRKLLSTLVVRAPGQEGTMPLSSENVILQLQELKVERGQHVQLGDSLAMLADHAELLIEGEAFEQDSPQVTQAVERGAPVSAVLEFKTESAGQVEGLHIAYVANRMDAESRTLHFYVTLPNKIVRDTRTANGRRFVEWRFKPGQRMQLQVPVEEWADRIVLPADAVAQDGVENYVFRSNGDHFDRQAVRVEYRDPHSVVVANDGSLFPGEAIALSAAQQLQLALKNKSGGAIDPHAGHNH